MKSSLSIWFLLISAWAYAQNWEHIRSIPLDENVSSVSIDSEGHIYLGSPFGNLQRLTPNGERDEFFSEITNSKVDLTEAWNRFKLFLFYRDLQKFILLDRFTTTPREYNLREFGIENGWLATPGVDNSLWVLTAENNELRKYSMQSKQMILNNPLTINVSQATHMRAYQNLLIIGDQATGLYIFDQYGNVIGKQGAKGVQYFQIYNGKIVYLLNGDIHFVDPFYRQNDHILKAPEGAFNKMLVSDQYYYFFERSRVLIYKEAL